MGAKISCATCSTCTHIIQDKLEISIYLSLEIYNDLANIILLLKSYSD